MSGNKDTALIVIGNEILSGRTQDANTGWLGQALGEVGLVLAEVRVVRDIEEEIVKAVNELRARYTYVFTTGGIGPTHDDITAQSIAVAFDTRLEMNEQAYQRLLSYYEDEKEVTSARKKMAMVPVGATLIDNPVSGAPGFKMENVYVFAGVPRIMQAMFEAIRGELKGGARVLSSTIACDLTESAIADELAAIQKNWPQTDIGSYPDYRGGILGLSVVVRTTDGKVLDQVTAEVIALIRHHGGEPKAISTLAGAA